MSKLLTPRHSVANVADLLDQLGGIAPSRVLLSPPPGKAKETDVVWLDDHANRLCELVDGVLVEKIMGAKESLLAVVIVHLLEGFVSEHDLGVVLGADGMLRLRPRLVRIPDVSFISWDRLPDQEFPDDPIPILAPNLAVEVLSEGNTKREMDRKLREYFAAGVRLVWLVDPRSSTIDAYTKVHEVRRYRNGQTLDGGDVLPGFKLPLRQLFTRAKRRRKNR